jgi:hypothetical protein
VDTQQTNTEVDVASRPNHLKLVSLDVTAFAGLDYTDKSLVIVFPEGKNITEFSGDQGMGKTSLANAISSLMGGDEPKNAVNSAKQTKAASLNFEANGNVYESRLTKSAYQLKMITDMPNGKKAVSDVKSPKTMLANIVGAIGVSPDFLKNKSKGSEQIEWIKSMAAQNTDISQKEEEYKTLFQKAYNNRTDINKSLKECQRTLNESGLYVWDAENKVYVESADYATHVKIEAEAPRDRIALDKKFAEAEKRHSQLLNGRDKVERLGDTAKKQKEDIKKIEDEILRLQAKLETEKQNLSDTEESIEKGKVYVEERKDAEKEYQEIRKEVMDYGSIETLRKLLSESKQTLDNYNTYEEAKKECEAIMDTCEADLKNLTKQYTPPIEGLEVVVANIDSAKPEGVYYQGKNIAHLCESELWDLCLQVWKCTGIRVVFIENSSSLGSDAVQRINWFANNGGYVFITTMQRGYKELKVSFHKELK